MRLRARGVRHEDGGGGQGGPVTAGLPSLPHLCCRSSPSPTRTPATAHPLPPRPTLIPSEHGSPSRRHGINTAPCNPGKTRRLPSHRSIAPLVFLAAQGPLHANHAGVALGDSWILPLDFVVGLSPCWCRPWETAECSFADIAFMLRNRSIPKAGYLTLSAYVELISQLDVPDESIIKKNGKAITVAAEPLNRHV